MSHALLQVSGGLGFLVLACASPPGSFQGCGAAAVAAVLLVSGGAEARKAGGE